MAELALEATLSTAAFALRDILYRLDDCVGNGLPWQDIGKAAERGKIAIERLGRK